MESPKVTMIITVHNSEKYLMECLFSVCNQTYKDIEIICVDGGSIDNSSQILNEFAESDGRIRVINDPNTSYGHKINVGVELARGVYIGIVESDDKIRPTMINDLCDIIEKYNPDIVDGDSFDFFDYHGRQLGYARSKYGEKRFYNRLLRNNEEGIVFSPGGIWSGLYRKSFLVKNNIKLNETPGAAYQDQGFAFLTSLFAETSYHIDKPVYEYRIDNNESSVKDDKKIFEIAWEYEFIENELKKRGVRDSVIWNILTAKKYTGYIWNMQRLSVAGQQQFKEKFKEELNKDVQKKIFERGVFSRNQEKILKGFWDDSNFFCHVEESKSLIDDIYDVLDMVDNKSVVVFGCGKCGLRIYSILKSNGTQVKCFCDNSEALQGNEIDGVCILSVCEAVERFADAIYIVANRNHYGDMINQLKNRGIKASNISTFRNV